ncbi:hypothetical protein SETIT_4G047300v2 [Setaria italica]|uniref:VAN3-binding protein-like auxin canalisation domain-containing protein n=1 Tax=Setaria italica TaxID=4555 RepID=A0A368QRE9_SETIT|nr:hypothetical protein SETIT_4G047300v2 [Setaria italica]
MELGDAWMAPDKLQHALACLLISLLAAALAARSSRPGLRRRAAAVGSAASLAAGAVKEALDEAGSSDPPAPRPRMLRRTSWASRPPRSSSHWSAAGAARGRRARTATPGSRTAFPWCDGRLRSIRFRLLYASRVY